MRVLVELLDKDPIKNVLGPCVFNPEIAVFLCDTRDSTFFKESAIYRLFKRRKLKTQPRFLYFDASDPVGVRRVLHAVARDYPGCVFDFSGGRDLVLLVAGASFAELQLPGFYIDIPAGRFINIRGCSALAPQFTLPQFSADDVLAMAGATVSGHGHFSAQAFTDSFEEDVLATFGVVCHNPKAWAEFVAWLQAACAGTPANQLAVKGARRMGQKRANPQLLNHLLQAGVLSRCQVGRSHVELVFKSVLHRKCLLIEGIWLELYCFVTAKRSGAFNDVRTSIVVDWDGVEGGADNTKNEVDVFLVKDVTPVFISCKMSLPSALALSEIRLLATKFGGSQARAVLLTAGRLGEGSKALRARAGELGIYLLDKRVLDEGILEDELVALAMPWQDPNTPRLVDAAMLP